MCIIIGGLRKNLKREEQIQGMRSNSSGFYVSVLREQEENGKKIRKVIEEIRTLRQDEALRIWDKAEPDDLVITHSRIPSHGPLTLENVHGWECEGVRFMHNGTMSTVADLMDSNDKRTDSEFFFKEVFIPLWKSQGKNFNKIVELVTNIARGSSRFCFILPNGEIKLMGDYEEDHECWFSNQSYKSYTSCYPGTYYGGYHGGRSSAGFGTVSGSGGSNVRPGLSGVVGGTVVAEPEPIELVREALGGDAGIAKFLIMKLVHLNVVSSTVDAASAAADGDLATQDMLSQTMGEMTTDFDSSSFNSLVVSLDKWLVGPPVDAPDLLNLYTDAADTIVTTYDELRIGNARVSVEDLLREDILSIKAMLRMCNTSFDWTASKLKKLVTSFKPVINRKHKLKMINRTPEELFSVPSSGVPKRLTALQRCQFMNNLESLFRQVKKGDVKW